jgi:UDP-N-acetylmuramoyl-tripeptide--D-alanyl-D-alanine ligase
MIALKSLLSLYSPMLPKYLAYMLQSTEYMAKPYLSWFWRSGDLTQVMKRRTLTFTRPAKLLMFAMAAMCILFVSISSFLLWRVDFNLRTLTAKIATVILICYPLIVAHAVVIPLVLGRIFVINPKQQAFIAKSEIIFNDHTAKKIAVMGSFGKTTMKEMLFTVLSQGLLVSKTPANLNVPISHARWASKLTGKEEVLIIEYGEGAPGDVGRFAAVTHPTHAVITGIAPAHLDQYKTLDAVVTDFASIQNFVPKTNIFANVQSKTYLNNIVESTRYFGSDDGVFGWNISDVKVSIEGTAFVMKKGKEILELKCGLLGEHQVAPVAFSAALGREFGLTKNEVEKGVSLITPHEHRMQPRLLSGAWIIDDTYNGNLEGAKAGCALLKALPGTRKTYVTPGLVDQGAESERVHKEMGQAIAASSADTVVLMQNSVTEMIVAGLREANFQGKIQIENNPLQFYTSLEQRVAVGDVVLMQNDWTDNYA